MGYNIRQFPAGKYVSPRNGNKDILGFKTLIIPSKESIKKHQESIKNTIKKHKNSAQAKLIMKLNPIIIGWCNYFQFSDAQTTHILSSQDNLIYQKLRAWGRCRCGNSYKAHKKYFIKIGKRNWIFATREGEANPLRLLFHSNFGSSSTEYVKVKGDRSPIQRQASLLSVPEWVKTPKCLILKLSS